MGVNPNTPAQETSGGTSTPPPHLAALIQAVTPILKSRDTHPYLEYLFDVTSKVSACAGPLSSCPSCSLLAPVTPQYILFLSRKVPGWWGTLLRLSSPLFSLLEGSATLLVIQVLGHGCRYIIATSLTRPSPPPGPSAGRRSSPLAFLSSIGLRGAEAWQLGFLVSSAVIYVISGWSLYLSFEGVAARGPEATLMMGFSTASVGWLTAIAFALGKGNVIETALIVSMRVKPPWGVLTDTRFPPPVLLRLLEHLRPLLLLSPPLPDRPLGPSSQLQRPSDSGLPRLSRPYPILSPPRQPPIPRLRRRRPPQGHLRSITHLLGRAG